MSLSLNQITYCLALGLMLLMFVHPSSSLPFRSRIFDSESSDIVSPEFARPDEADLQRNSARLHRTLFLLDTSDLLKKARLFGDKSTKESTRAKRQTGLMIRVRKPTLTLHDSHESAPSAFDALGEMRQSSPI